MRLKQIKLRTQRYPSLCCFDYLRIPFRHKQLSCILLFLKVITDLILRIKKGKHGGTLVCQQLQDHEVPVLTLIKTKNLLN